MAVESWSWDDEQKKAAVDEAWGRSRLGGEQARDMFPNVYLTPILPPFPLLLDVMFYDGINIDPLRNKKDHSKLVHVLIRGGRGHSQRQAVNAPGGAPSSWRA